MASALSSASQALRRTCSTLAEWLRPVGLTPREEPLHVTFAFHVECIADARVFELFLGFIRWLRAETQCAPLACVMTPRCPVIAAQMTGLGVSEGEYESRVGQLAEVAELGYHGHFYVRHPSPGAAQERCTHLLGDGSGQPDWELMCQNSLSPMSQEAFDESVVSEQMAEELDWLRARHENIVTYVAGWWMLNEGVVRLLEQHGIEADCSIRRHHPNTFGGSYLSDDDILPGGEPSVPPRGEPFILPPSQGIVEIQSGFYPVDHPRRTKELLAPTLSHRPDQPLFMVFPSHEGEAIQLGRVFRENVHMLMKWPDRVRWASVHEQVELVRSANVNASSAAVQKRGDDSPTTNRRASE